MQCLKTPKTKAAAGGRAARRNDLQDIRYHVREHLSRHFSTTAPKSFQWIGRISGPVVQELLGRILFALNYPTATDDEKAMLLYYVDGLERRLIDIRRGGVHG
ncbi:hypothetical protein ACFL5Z_09995 [Planctomycetota bacterium]